MASVEYLNRSIFGSCMVKKHLEFWGKPSKKNVKQYLELKAQENKLENFKVLEINKHKCLECFDTGVSKHDGCACC
jgi:hypothetical protein